MRAPIRQAERLIAIRLRTAINTHLRTVPAQIGAAVGLPAVEASSLLTRRQ